MKEGKIFHATFLQIVLKLVKYIVEYLIGRCIIFCN